MAKKTDRVNLTMPKELINQARAKAIADGLNLSEVVRRFLRAWLADELELPKEKSSNRNL
jgi:hypothetical protein